MANYTLNLNPELYNYMLAHSLREHPVLSELRELTATLPHAKMQISPEQGQFMAWLVETIGAKKALEIGTFTGYSALAVALALPPDGKLIACDISTEWCDIAKQHWAKVNMADKIDLRIAPALETLDQLLASGAANSFDFIFIDADKANYPHYYTKSLALLRQGGVIALDNVFKNGKVLDPVPADAGTQAVAALNKQLLQDERVSLTMLPISDGLTLLRKR